MIPRRPRAGLVWWLIPLVILAGALRVCAAQPKGELLIVERPAHLTVLNRYQQTLARAEKAVLQPFVPMVVVNAHDMLGDGFTPCMRVRINGSEFFLVRDASGRLAGEAQAGTVAAFEGTVHAGDTIIVLRAGALAFRAPGAPRVNLLGAGERIVRIFSRGAQTYVRRPTASDAHGWVDLAPSGEGRSWVAARLAPVLPSTVPPAVIDQVRSALARTNSKLAGIFQFLAARGTPGTAVPRWEAQAEGPVVRCTLIGGSAVNDFPESTRYLMREVEDRIAGSGFRTVAMTDGFEVRPD